MTFVKVLLVTMLQKKKRKRNRGTIHLSHQKIITFKYYRTYSIGTHAFPTLPILDQKWKKGDTVILKEVFKRTVWTKWKKSWNYSQISPECLPCLSQNENWKWAPWRYWKRYLERLWEKKSTTSVFRSVLHKKYVSFYNIHICVLIGVSFLIVNVDSRQYTSI